MLPGLDVLCNARTGNSEHIVNKKNLKEPSQAACLHVYLREHRLEREKELNGNVEEETKEPLGWAFGSRKRCHNQELKVSKIFSPVIKRTDRPLSKHLFQSVPACQYGL